MKKFLVKIVFVFVCIILITCKKYRHNYIQGKVLENGTNTGIEGATVILQYWGHGKNANYMYDSTYTDSKGNFKFYRREKINWQYRLSARDSYHLGSLSYTSGEDIDKQKPPYIFYLDPLAFMKLRVKKTTNAPNSISISAKNYYFNFINTNPFDTIINKVLMVPASFTVYWSVKDGTLPTSS